MIDEGGPMREAQSTDRVPIDRSISAVIARLRFGDSDGDDHDIAADEIVRLRTAIETHNVECLSLCNDKKDCGYAQYKRRCTHCPADWLIELPAHDVGGKL